MGALLAPFVVDALEGGARELGWAMTAQAIGGIALIAADGRAEAIP